MLLPNRVVTCCVVFVTSGMVFAGQSQDVSEKDIWLRDCRG
jgi:hypothetical protein